MIGNFTGLRFFVHFFFFSPCSFSTLLFSFSLVLYFSSFNYFFASKTPKMKWIKKERKIYQRLDTLFSRSISISFRFLLALFSSFFHLYISFSWDFTSICVFGSCFFFFFFFVIHFKPHMLSFFMMKRPLYKCLMVNFWSNYKLSCLSLSPTFFRSNVLRITFWFAHSLMFNVHLFCRFHTFCVVIFICSIVRAKEVRMSINLHVCEYYGTKIWTRTIISLQVRRARQTTTKKWEYKKKKKKKTHTTKYTHAQHIKMKKDSTPKYEKMWSHIYWLHSFIEIFGVRAVLIFNSISYQKKCYSSIGRVLMDWSLFNCKNMKSSTRPLAIAWKNFVCSQDILERSYFSGSTISNIAQYILADGTENIRRFNRTMRTSQIILIFYN